MTDARPSLPRYHALDRLRAVMMGLGVVRHASVSYQPTVFEGWPYRDAQADILVHWVIVFIRVFQLPVFFAIAGFFAAYLVHKRGVGAFLRQRWSRIGVPFLVAWPVMGITMYLVLAFISRFAPVPPDYVYSEVLMQWARVERYLFMHLWFLYHLMILCVAASGVCLLAARIPERLRVRALDFCEGLVHRGGVTALVLATAASLYQMQSWQIDYYAGPVPPLRLLALWGLFFGFGWLLFRRRATLEGFKPPAWTHLALGVACFFVYRHFADAGCHAGADRICTGTSVVHHLGTVVFLALSMWLLTYALFGLFLRYLDRPSRRWRYLADASYWIYIVHVPLVMLLPLLLADAPLPGIVKLALVVAAATGLALVAYRYLVRPTFIGKQLNGRRHARGAA
ncbi:MAG: acyltransferase family protein [Acidobacteriota bacterium]|nr:acyltransferase family protein [Acidobacteriota bacterium]